MIGTRRMVGRAACAAMLASVAAAGSGCIIVVEDHDSEYREWKESRRHYIGVSLDSVSRETAAQLSLDRDLVTLISHVYTGTPAERAGLAKYDVITTVDGAGPASPARVRAAIREKKPGDEIRLGIVRGAQPMDIVVTVEER